MINIKSGPRTQEKAEATSPNQDSTITRSQRQPRRTGVRLQVHPRPVLQDEPNSGNQSRRKVPVVRLKTTSPCWRQIGTYLISIFHHLLFSSFSDFSHCIFEFSKHSCMLVTFLEPFCFHKNTKIFPSIKILWKINLNIFSKQSLASTKV